MQLTFLEKIKIKMGVLKFCPYCRCFSCDPKHDACDTCEQNIEILGERFRVKLAVSSSERHWFEKERESNIK